MSDALPETYLARHGETEWTITGQHTGLTDIPLTPRGEANARGLGDRLRGLEFARVIASPLRRSRHTCEIAGFADHADFDRDLMEWDYGAYEGLTTAEIRSQRPDWDLFRDGRPGGETLDAISARADRVVAKIREGGGRVLVFSHSHFLRVLATRWLGLPATQARYLVLGTAALSIVGYEHNLAEPAIRLWNDDRHIRSS